MCYTQKNLKLKTGLIVLYEVKKVICLFSVSMHPSVVYLRSGELSAQ